MIYPTFLLLLRGKKKVSEREELIEQVLSQSRYRKNKDQRTLNKVIKSLLNNDPTKRINADEANRILDGKTTHDKVTKKLSKKREVKRQ